MHNKTKIIALSSHVRFLLPPLFISSIKKNAIGFSFERGLFGWTVGSALIATSIIIGYLPSSEFGILSYALSFWLIGGTGLFMMYNCMVQRIAFVKPLCLRCRLLPLIIEHEEAHLDGISQDDEIWSIMRGKYLYLLPELEKDRDICYFCPIPRRIREE